MFVTIGVCTQVTLFLRRMHKGRGTHFNSQIQTQVNYSKAQQAFRAVPAGCVWPVYVYRRATWDMSVRRVVLPHLAVPVEFCDSHSFLWVTHTHEERVLQVVFWAAHCAAGGLEDPAVVCQGVSQARRAWISFSLQPSGAFPSERECVGAFLCLALKRWMCC